MEFLTSEPVIALVIEGIHAIETVRKLAGHTVPNLSIPGTIRGDLASISALHSNMKNRAIMNLIHTSGNKEEAEREIALWFNDPEIYNYKTILENHIT